MARVISNKYQGTVTLHFTANGSITVAGNTSSSNVALMDASNTYSENLAGASIRQIWFGSEAASGAAFWTVKRGSNTVAILSGTDHMDYAGHGGAIGLDSGATLVVNLTGDSGYIMIEMAKIPQRG